MPPSPPNPPPRRFWARITEGSSLGQLWRQLKNDSLFSYRLYARDLEVERVRQGVTGRRRKGVLKALFWAIFTKLSPAKRVVLLIALVLVILPGTVSNGRVYNYCGIGALLLFGLLVLEIADRVTLKRDLEIARDIQLWLLPPQPPPVPDAGIAFFNRPMNTVSGDLYDAFWCDGPAARRLILTVADVAGKGVPAALLGASYQAGLHTLCQAPVTIAAIATGLNRTAVSQSTHGERFTTAFLAEYDPGGKVLRFVNAGHNPPLLCRASGAIERLEAGGPPLGILPEAAYEEGATALGSGDLLFVFSDGLIEAEDPQGRDYGEERLRSLLAQRGSASAQELLQRVLADFDRFTAGAPRQDDVTCLVFRCL